MSGIARGSDKFSAGLSGLVKKNLDCTVAAPSFYYMFSLYHVCLLFYSFPILVSRTALWFWSLTFTITHNV